MRIRRLPAIALVGTVLVSGIAQGSYASNPGVTATPLGHAGRWITDDQGRVVIVHGVNVVPTAPDTTAGFDDDDASFLAANGFNAVRLGWQMSALEPKPGQFDEHYLDTLSQTVQLLARHGIYTLIDMHQDEWGPSIGIRGFPDWMTLTDALPAPPTGGAHPVGYWTSPAINRAWKHLWADDRLPDGGTIQDHFVSMWQHVALKFKGNPWVLGYDILNEPYPGEGHEYPVGDCWNPAIADGCPTWDALLAQFNRRVVSGLHAVDPGHIAWYEAGQHVYTGRPNHLGKHVTGRAGLSLHVYCLEALGLAQTPVTGAYCDSALEKAFAEADRHAAVSGDALLISEFGATRDPGFWTQLTGFADKHMDPWTMWSYGELAGDWNAKGAPKANAAVLAAVVRPYPRLIAGTPTSFGFDPTTKVFTFRYSTTSPTGRSFTNGGVSEIYVPALQYPHGYQVSVQGGRVITAAGAPILQVRADRAARKVTVSVRAR